MVKEKQLSLRIDQRINNIINDYDSFAKYKITNCIIEAFVCVRGCTDCRGDDQNICKTCYTGYVKA